MLQVKIPLHDTHTHTLDIKDSSNNMRENQQQHQWLCRSPKFVCCGFACIALLCKGFSFFVVGYMTANQKYRKVVEEWGCQDSEIRLTCSNLDSTIAILEATFKPNCTLSGRNSENSSHNGNGTDAQSDNCVQIDLKRLTPPKHEPIYDETIAGRRFLEALRQHRKETEERNQQPTVQTVKTASFNFGLTPKDAQSDGNNELKRKRMTLRASLEELLVEYLNLRSLAADGDGLNDDRSRVKRDTLRRLKRFRRNDQNRNENSDAENVNSFNEENRVQNNQSARIRLEHIETDDNTNATTNATKSECPQRRQRITQLDRNELAIALQSDSDHEHNIRRMLNYRCSGKNHCRVVFNEHHPFSVLWPYGTVHIKYICMERYRMNKFCGEHLKVKNESPEPEMGLSLHQRSVPRDNDIQNDDSGIKRNGPIAEALIQNEQQMFHSLKILKPSPSEMENERRKSAAIAETVDKTPYKKGVYSQDFRAMKVLPANLDDINDIEKIGDEFYFKKEVDVDNDNIDDDIMNREHSQRTKAIVETTQPTMYTSHRKPIESSIDGKNFIENAFDSSNNGLRDVRSTLGYDEMHNPKYHSSIQPISQTIPTADTVTHTQQQQPSDTVNLWNNELLPPNTDIFETRPDDIDVSYDIFSMSGNQTKAKLDEKIVRAKNDFTLLKTDRADIDRELESGEDYDSYEDYEVEIDGPKVWRKNKVRTHLSYQKTGLLLRPLQQGFIASPGYPSYYIGNSNCSWRITVDSGQPIRLILLDVSLRYDPACKDYLQIIDVGSKIILHQNCTELDKPVEIISQSNEVNIALKASSTLAYPKRGILIYYAALGCIVPPPPNYGQLVSQTEDSIKFLCDPSFIFPDTLLGSRTLYCTERNTWDNSLPDCVERTSVKTKKEDPFIQQLWKQNRLGGRQDDQADLLFDVLIPLMLIVGLLVVNGFIVLIIWRYRQKRKNEQDSDQLARL